MIFMPNDESEPVHQVATFTLLLYWKTEIEDVDTEK